MRSSAELFARHTKRLVAAVALLLLSIAQVPAVSAQSSGEQVTEKEVAAALEQLKADPNLSRERKTRTLRWQSDEKPQERKPGSFARWIMGFFTWLAELSRALVWVLGALLALVLIWLGLRLLRTVGPMPPTDSVVMPTHVRDLDIRPESLPADIGATAFALWERAEHRSALALLYRGLLSRLVHSHRIPVRDSSTEGDCLELAARHLPVERREYVARLIGVWQRATYGGRDPETQDVQALCSQFDVALSPARDAEVRAS